ncbi:YgiW/YdeI family stress tolerance OB fold protein [Vibrio sp. Y29_XK_CS5]|uniref:YgiW/YdeI family stress tolerance OB fold protein n=1 Tax=Vibrio sp. Y29_XK_CS5 TaxID=2957762 RepID=UPI0020A395C3|nr:NirD/YgiW/YdeI family stress tolerance protein [Vibrio sp. Y29_XK_CS5]
MNHRVFNAAIPLFFSGLLYAQNFSSLETKKIFGFSGPSQGGLTKVKQVWDIGVYSDDMPVILTGYIKSHLGGEMYIFTDHLGRISIEIEHSKWLGQSVTPKTRVRLSGEVDNDVSGTKINVDNIQIL